MWETSDRPGEGSSLSVWGDWGGNRNGDKNRGECKVIKKEGHGGHFTEQLKQLLPIHDIVITL